MVEVPVSGERSAAVAQRSLADPAVEYPLWPVLTSGCPKTSTPEIAYPLEVDYDYGAMPRDMFRVRELPSDIHAWAPALPPLHDGLRLGTGGTPVIREPRLDDYAGGVRTVVKDESRNPTWSHKDRLNLCAVSAAALGGAPGVVVASSGNHGASAAAFSARAGLPSVVIATEGSSPPVLSFLAAYGASVVVVPREARRAVLNDIVERLGFHPVSNRTGTHTGHPFGPEGYKTIAYELYLQLGQVVPDAVFVPTGYAELLYGTWKGFRELRSLGITADAPRMFSCEPAARGPLAAAVAHGLPAATVEAVPTEAFSIGTTTSGYRGVLALQESGGAPILLTDEEMRSAATQLARTGLWQEMSGAASLAGVRKAVAQGLVRQGSTVVCLATSSGFKDKRTGSSEFAAIDPDWSSVSRYLRSHGIA